MKTLNRLTDHAIMHKTEHYVINMRQQCMTLKSITSIIIS